MGYGQSAACRHLRGVYQLGVAGFPAGVGMAHHEPRSERAGILGGRHFRGDFHVYHRLGVALGPYDVEIRRGQSHCSFRGADRNGLGRLLRRPELLGVVADCHTIRSWRRRR